MIDGNPVAVNPEDYCLASFYHGGYRGTEVARSDDRILKKFFARESPRIDAEIIPVLRTVVNH